jgi:hypothetical protein
LLIYAADALDGADIESILAAEISWMVSFDFAMRLVILLFTQRVVRPRPKGRGYKAHLNWNFAFLADCCKLETHGKTASI